MVAGERRGWREQREILVPAGAWGPTEQQQQGRKRTGSSWDAFASIAEHSDGAGSCWSPCPLAGQPFGVPLFHDIISITIIPLPERRNKSWLLVVILRNTAWRNPRGSSARLRLALLSPSPASMIHWLREYTFEAAWVSLSQRLVAAQARLADDDSFIEARTFWTFLREALERRRLRGRS